ncbi:MAG: tetratricopeptide repeat protein [Spirochaetota bacterium]
MAKYYTFPSCIVAVVLCICTVSIVACKKNSSLSYEEQKKLLSTTPINTKIKKIETSLESVKDDNKKTTLLTDLAVLQLEKGDVTSAMKSSARAVEVSKDDFRALYIQGKSSLMAGSYSRSVECLSRSIKANDSFAPAHYEMGNVYYKRGDYRNAIKKYDRALELDEKNIDTMNNLAVVCASAGRLKRAEKLLHRVIELQNDNATAHRNLGILYDAHLDNPKRAMNHYKRYLAIVPGASDRNLVELWISRVKDVNK